MPKRSFLIDPSSQDKPEKPVYHDPLAYLENLSDGYSQFTERAYGETKEQRSRPSCIDEHDGPLLLIGQLLAIVFGVKLGWDHAGRRAQRMVSEMKGAYGGDASADQASGQLQKQMQNYQKLMDQNYLMQWKVLDTGSKSTNLPNWLSDSDKYLSIVPSSDPVRNALTGYLDANSIDYSLYPDNGGNSLLLDRAAMDSIMTLTGLGQVPPPLVPVANGAMSAIDPHYYVNHTT